MNWIMAQLGMLAALPGPVKFLFAAGTGALAAFWVNQQILRWSRTRSGRAVGRPVESSETESV